LRTPLTTLRLYLDMLTTGLVHEETKRSEYLNTLNTESDRLHRLIGNVLDFSRLEKQSARTNPHNVAVVDLVEHIRGAWQSRCDGSDKELVIDNQLPSDLHIQTDPVLVQQIVGNLIDNACKYSKCATDRRVWLRVLPAGQNRLAIEVEDCGPGIGRRDWRSIFRPFRRGHDADTTAGGVGLGLALARRWAAMLGGRLDLCKGEHGAGACFRLEFPRG
jgi:signal transduction histidine kinase